MPRRVLVAVVEPVRPMDVAAPIEVFSAARLADGPAYEVELVAPRGGWVATGSALRLAARSMEVIDPDLVDTLVVSSSRTVPVMLEARTVEWLTRAIRGARRVAAVGTGALVLAELGLLDGRPATTHWSVSAEFARRHPGAPLERDVLFAGDGSFYSSAGATAVIDLALALVEDDVGADAALEIARDLVMFAVRSGRQSQISAQLSVNVPARKPIRELQAWIAENLDADLSVAVLASRLNMSTRSFARAFSAETGTTPAAYVQALRVELARIALDRSDEPLKVVAHSSGFGNVERMRRAFHRCLGVSPATYRARGR